MKPLVSILIPAFNAQAHIEETLASAIAQTWPRTEIIVVDDGSTDRTLAVARRYASRSVRVVSQENQGAAATRNSALSLSQGDYIQWLDADDLLGPDKIEQQMLASDGLPARTLLSSAWGRFINRQSRARFVPTALWHDLPPVEWLLRKLDQNLYMQTATWLVSRDLTASAGPWDTRLAVDDDGEYFCRVLLQSDRIRFVPAARVFHRMSGVTGLSYIGSSHTKMDAQFRSMQMHIGYLRSLEDSDRVRAACVTYLQNGLTTFHPERPDIVRQANLLAAGLGGQLTIPRLSLKYAAIAAFAGRHRTKRAQAALRRFRWSVARMWDKTFFR